MAFQTVEVTIDPQGKVTVETKGVVGQGCEALSRAIEQSIGSTIDNARKPEFFQQAQAGQQASAGSGM